MTNSQKINASDFTPSAPELFVVGIGASAGGLNALEELFAHLPTDSGAAFVIIQHLSPDFQSLMPELLQRHTEMMVMQVTEDMELQPNSVYLIPPGKNLVVEAKLLRLEERKRDKNDQHEFNFPIDLFFDSLAKNYGDRAIAVILSGLGSDGTRGLKAIKEVEGIVFVQAPETAEFDGMPCSAISTDLVDGIFPVRELAQVIDQCIAFHSRSQETKLGENSLLNSSTIKAITDILIDTEDLDFSHYKPNTISRRIHRRLLINNSQTLNQYIELLRTSTEEREILSADLLIKVTRFFRDISAWLKIENNVLPLLIKQAKPNDELRFWVTACSTGEEAYSLAILVHEALQNLDKPLTVKIFATDIDKIALEKASLGIYPESIASEISFQRLQRYFIAYDNCYQVSRILREMMIFSVHDLTKNTGFTRMNLVSCRNVLIYMQSDLQNKVIRNLHFSLVNQGILFLGEAETLGNVGSEFKPLDQKWKIYRKRRDSRLPIPLRDNPRIVSPSLSSIKTVPSNYQKESIVEQVLKRILQASDSISLVVDRDNRLLYVSGNSQSIFKTPDGEISNEVTKMVVQPLKLPLYNALHRAKQEKKSVSYRNIQLNQGKEVQQINLCVMPPDAESPEDDLFIVQIELAKAIDPQLIVSLEKFESNHETQKQILELEKELQYTRENLQALVQELETTNEKQQAFNEELTASNEELHTVNIEYQSKIQELTQLNDDIDNLLKSTEIGVIFLDTQLRIRKFTPAANKVVSLRHTDIERPLEELSLKIECPNLLDLLQEVLETKEPRELDVKLKQQDFYFLMRINLYQTDSARNEGLVISFVKLDEIKQVQQELEQEIIARIITEQKLREIQAELEQRVTERTQTLANFSDRLKQLHRLATTEHQQLDSLFADYLQAGCQMLNLSTGIISEVNNYTYKIVALQSPLNLTVGYQVPCVDTYCAEVIEAQKTVALTQVGKIPSMQNNYSYVNLKLESFIGTPILVNGNLYGTLNFSDTAPRQSEFTQEEKDIVELMARDIGQFIASVQSQITLKESETRFRKTFEQAAVGVAHVSPEGRFIRLNQRFCDIVGYENDRFLQLTFQEITHADDLATDLEYVRQLLAGEIESYSMEKRYIHCNGSIIWINLTVSLVRNSLKEPDYFIAVIEDISERKRTEIALNESKENTEKLKSFNQAKDSFIAHMSHELRTPLNSILGFTQILQKDSNLTKQQLHYLSTVNHSGQHLLTLINDILDFSKITAKKLELEPQNFSLVEFLRETTINFRLRAQQKGLEFFVYISPILPEIVNTDPTRLRQVLDNLISNAIKFTPTGTVSLNVDCLEDRLDENFNTIKIRFQIEDTGIGICFNNFTDIFTPFAQFDKNIKNYEGTGLGLTISDKIIQIMGSEIKLESQVGYGSRFWFDLELLVVKNSLLPTPSDPNNLETKYLNTHSKILVVDDNEDNRLLLVSYLKPLGFTLAEANNGKEGLELAETFQPDAILVDLIMPVMDGKEMIAKIKQQASFPNTIVILISANRESIIEQPSAIDYHGFLPKPVDLEQLLDLLDSHLQLDWQYQKVKEAIVSNSEQDNLATIIVPPRTELIKLLELAELGDIKAIQSQINSLEVLDTQYIDFLNKIKQLTTNFQQYELEIFIKKFIDR